MRMHWKTYSEIRDRWTWQIKAACRVSVERASIEIERFYAGQPLDLDNAYAACKVPLDALRHAGVIKDDDPESVVGLKVRQHKVSRRKNERTRIIITAEAAQRG